MKTPQAILLIMRDMAGLNTKNKNGGDAWQELERMATA